jgi:dihydroorotase/N-acyl-D-amino-acid deacylase
MMRKLFLHILACIFMVACGPQESYDLIIVNGLVYDGTTNQPQINDLGIIGDKIVKIGRLHDKKFTYLIYSICKS